MLPNEQEIIEDVKTPYNKYFVPLVWSTSLVTRARKEGRIKDDFAVKTLIDVSLSEIKWKKWHIIITLKMLLHIQMKHFMFYSFDNIKLMQSWS